MATILLARINVEDYDKWRQAFESKTDLRKRSGCLGTHIFRNAKDANEVIINFQWDSEQSVQKFISSEEGQRAMMESGMIGAPDLWFLEDAGRTEA